MPTQRFSRSLIDSTTFHRQVPRFSLIIASLVALAIAGCFGGEGKEGPPADYVKTGFGGDLNATYVDGLGGLSNAGGTGAAIGAGQGKVLGGLMTVTRLSDGAVLGSAVTDSETGLVTIKPRQSDLPVLITLTGQKGATYFDEGKNAFVPFEEGQTLHALVDKFDENVGVSALTEAAYRYALNNFIADPKAIANGSAPLLATGDVTGLTMAQVQAANGIVQSEVNRTRVTALQLASAKSLPTPIDNQSPSTALPNNRYGIAATTTGGLAVNSAYYQSDSEAPAVEGTEQLARDLTDGTINGFALDGTPAAPGSRLSYSAVQLATDLDVTTAAVSKQYGIDSTYGLGQRFIAQARTMHWLFPRQPPVCPLVDDIALLGKDASITVYRSIYEDVGQCEGLGCCRISSEVALKEFATEVKALARTAMGYLLQGRAHFVGADGTVWGWGSANCGTIAGEASSSAYVESPVQVAGLSGITAVAEDALQALARDKHGNVYVWGAAKALGLPPESVGEIECGGPGGPVRYPQYAPTPTRISSLSNIVSIAVETGGSFAIDDKGVLYEWNFSSSDGYVYTPRADPNISGVLSIISTIDWIVALKLDGTVWYGSAGRPYLPVSHLSDVVAIGGDETVFLALRRDGTVAYWFSTYGIDFSTQPLIASASQLPLIRDIRGRILFGIDGKTYWCRNYEFEEIKAPE